jgi:hypothetical protein
MIKAAKGSHFGGAAERSEAERAFAEHSKAERLLAAPLLCILKHTRKSKEESGCLM